MKGKLLVISLLVGLLVFTVYKMMQYEQSIREDHIIRTYVEDETKPLIEKLESDDLREILDDIQYHYRTGKTYFQVKNKDDEWQDIFLKGVNLGVAVPGKFPAEFSLTFEQYLDWLKEIGEMNANVIRTYTILPPEFYKALAYYNLHHKNKPVYIMQGVWATVPEDEYYYNTAYTRRFQKEIIDVLDVIHGNAVLQPKPGKAHGVYATDVSKYVLGYLLGREWEPKGVYKTIHKNKNDHFEGNFVSINNGNSMEVWLAKMMDFTVRYETQTYQWQHPVSFVNWLPLDPMYHDTEYIENKKVKEYDNDLMQLDFRKFNATPMFKAGIYAAYHVYPYYPDFIYQQKEYIDATNHKGEKDNFFGYLQDLKHHTAGLPLVIAEYGLPTSRGISHFTPSGFNQGGHSKARQAELSLTLTEDIRETNCAGAIYFEWADEWFKHNWLVLDFEIPYENRKLWHNMENPEQNFGILALENREKTIDGSFKDWQMPDSQHIRLSADADATYFYLAAKLPDFDFNKNNLYIAIDTYDKEKGDHKLPFSDKLFDNGFEFLCRFKSPDSAKILVDEPYSVFTDIYNDYIPVYASKRNENGKFIDEMMLVNRSRETLTGTKTDSILNDRSPLIMGKSNKPETSNADWYWSKDSTQLELRLDWHLINVSDPSHHYVLDDKAGTKSIEASQTDGFKIYMFVTDKQNHVLKQFPANEPYNFTWEEWQMPKYSERKKPLYDTLQKYFSHLSPKKIIQNPHPKEKFEIANYYQDKQGAISITFDNLGYSQYAYGYPLLNKYQLQADFSIVDAMQNTPNKTEMDEGIKIKRMGLAQVKEILTKGNELALQSRKPIVTAADLLNKALGKELSVVHLKPKQEVRLNGKHIFVRKHGSNKAVQTDYTCNRVPYSIIPTHISTRKLDSLLHLNKDKWNVLVYHHIYKDTLETHHIDKEILKHYYLPFDEFRKQIRLARNTGYWIGTESEVYKYLYEKAHSKIETKTIDNIILLKVVNRLNPSDFNQKLSVKYYTGAKSIKVYGDDFDKIYENKTGYIVFDVLPNRTVRIEILE